jgi:hypothetical protein
VFWGSDRLQSDKPIEEHVASIFVVFYSEDGGSLFIRNVAQAYEKLKKEPAFSDASCCINRSSGQGRRVLL